MKKGIILAYLVTITSLVLLGLFVFFRISYHNLLYPSVAIASIPMGGVSPSEAKEILKQKAATWSSSPLTFTYKNQVWGITPEKLGVTIKTDEMVQNAFNFGHDQNLGVDILVFARTMEFLKPYNVDTAAEVDFNKFTASTQQYFQNIETTRKNSTVIYKNNKFIIQQAKDGIEVDRKTLLQNLRDNISTLSNAPIELNLMETAPDIKPEEATAARDKAEKISSTSLNLSYNDKKWQIPTETIAKWIKFGPVTDPKDSNNKILGIDIDKDAVKDHLENLAPEINIEPVNAELAVKNGKVEVFALSQDGLRLETDKSSEKIIEALKLDRKADEDPVQLVVESQSPMLTTDNINNLGITSLIGIGKSNFAGSPKNRRHNINVGAAKFNGILVKPGEEFSFVNTLGPITTKEGYRAELVIKNGATIPELGGGLCQVSTTAFRAALNSGLPITERKAHAYAVSYYSPIGMDATIYPPHPDLRFTNDTPGYILIQTKIDGNNITFEFYGTDDGRKVKIRGPQVYDKKSDGSMKTVFYRDIFRDEQLVKTDTFRSTYKSPALYPHKNPLE